MTIRIRRSTGGPVVLGGADQHETAIGEPPARTDAPEGAETSTATPLSGSAVAARARTARGPAAQRGAQVDLFSAAPTAGAQAQAKPMTRRKAKKGTTPSKPRKSPAAPATKAAPKGRSTTSPPSRSGGGAGGSKRSKQGPLGGTRKPPTKTRAARKPATEPHARRQPAAPRPSKKSVARTAQAATLPVTPEPAASSVDTPARATAATRRRATAESMATKQRDISVSEFFMKNRHLLGFDSPARALLTTVKEAFDNSLDACEEAGILPTVRVELVEINDERYRVIVEDNGPGIVKAQIPKVFGKLLYGSKFHRLRQSRGQQGIGVSAAGMYGQLTTGKPVVITSKTGKGRPAHHFEIVIDTARNTPNIVKDETVDWDRDHGTRVEIELQGTYKGGRRSVDEYIEQAAIANPHAEIHYQPPKGRPAVHVERAANELPREPLEIKPHPYGVELGMLQKILQDADARTLSSALQNEFSRVTSKVADEIIRKAALAPRTRPRDLRPGEIERLHKAIPQVKIFSPPTACVVPIGEDLIHKGLEREIRAEFYTSATRPPAVYRGNPFQVEAGLAYGGELREGRAGEDGDVHTTARESDAQAGPITLLRLANRVPLQYQQSACATFKAVVDTNWRAYGLVQPRGALPQGPMVLMVHIASVWVPFTSESKEAVAHYPEILKEIQLALQECGRRLGGYLRRREAARHEERRRSIFEMYIGELVESLGKLTPVDRAKLQKELASLARKHTGADEDVEAMVEGTKRTAKRADELSAGERRAAGKKVVKGVAQGRGRGRRGRKRAASPQLELLQDEEETS